MNEKLTSISAYLKNTDLTGGNYTYPYEQYYYGCFPIWNNQNNIEKSFKLVQKLIDKKYVKITNVKQFIELVNELSDIL